MRKAQSIITDGYKYVVDLDLECFFDTVSHSKLIEVLSRSIKDGRVISLIHKYLRSGVMVNGLFVRSEEGTPQGDPLSPLLSNVMLNELDKELENRGLPFIRYAEDSMIFCRSKRAAERVRESITNFIEGRLHLKVNKGKDAKVLAEVVIHLLKPFKNIIKTISTDNGTEFACHERISQALETPVYFADPYSSWQKGGIENENGLIRQYIPKSTKMLDVSHQDVNRIMHKINRRPREKLNFATPIECFYEKLS